MPLPTLTRDHAIQDSLRRTDVSVVSATIGKVGLAKTSKVNPQVEDRAWSESGLAETKKETGETVTGDYSDFR